MVEAFQITGVTRQVTSLTGQDLEADRLERSGLLSQKDPVSEQSGVICECLLGGKTGELRRVVRLREMAEDDVRC